MPQNSETVSPILPGSLASGFDDLQGVVFCNRCEVLVVVQQRAMMFECRGGNNAVVGLADGNALLSQLAVNIRCPSVCSFGHWQHDQWTKIAPDAPVGGVIGNALEDFCQYDAAQGKVFVIEDEFLQRGHMRKVTTREDVDPDAGANQSH
jgi:hypothetical protein